MKILSFIPKISTTEFAIYEGGAQILQKTIEHSPADLHALLTPPAQGNFRYHAIIDTLGTEEILLQDIDVVVTQMASSDVPPGIYLVNNALLEFLAESKLEENILRSGAFIAHLLAEHIGRYDVECLPFIIEPAINNEITPEASLSGFKGVTRVPVFHAFSQRAAAALYAFDHKKDVNDIRAVIAHLGTEISVGAFDRGRIVDSNSPLDGEGPFSPTTSGTLPVDALVRLCYSGKYDMDELLRLVNEEGGLQTLLGSGKIEQVRKSWQDGNEKTRFMVQAMAYQVAREIGARAAALSGHVEGIILTGPWACFDEFIAEIVDRVSWIAPASVHVWESELFMLAIAGLETYHGNNKILLYGQDRVDFKN